MCNISKRESKWCVYHRLNSILNKLHVRLRNHSAYNSQQAMPNLWPYGIQFLTHVFWYIDLVHVQPTLARSNMSCEFEVVTPSTWSSSSSGGIVSTRVMPPSKLDMPRFTLSVAVDAFVCWARKAFEDERYDCMGSLHIDVGLHRFCCLCSVCLHGAAELCQVFLHKVYCWCRL